MKALLVPLSLIVLGAGAVLAGGVQQEPDIRSEPVAGSVHVLFGRGGNVGASIGADGVLLIDDKFADLEEPIRAALKGRKGEKIRFLVNTHWHGDHTGANEGFGKEAVIVAQENVRARLAGTPQLPGRSNETPAPAAALPVVTYADGISLHFNGEEVRLLHLPNAHTDGDTVVWFTGSKVVHMGDLYFDVGYPFIDTSSGGGIDGLIAGVKKVLATVPADVKVISGHGRVTGTKELREYVSMLEAIRERVAEAKGLGQTAQQMVDNGLTKDFDDRWGSFEFVPPVRFVEAVLGSVGG